MLNCPLPWRLWKMFPKVKAYLLRTSSAWSRLLPVVIMVIYLTLKVILKRVKYKWLNLLKTSILWKKFFCLNTWYMCYHYFKSLINVKCMFVFFEMYFFPSNINDTCSNFRWCYKLQADKMPGSGLTVSCASCGVGFVLHVYK